MSGYDRASGPYREADPEVVEIDTVAVVAPGDEAADDTRELQDRIEDTRADMGETIDAIQERLSPRRIGEQVREQVRGATIGRAEQMVSDATDTAREAGGGLVDLLRDNPVPAALAALGLGWLWLKRPGGQGGGGRRAPAGGYGGYRGGYGAYDRGDGYRGAGYPAGGYRAGGYRDDDDDDGGPGDAVRRGGQRARRAAGQAADRAQDAAGQAAGAVQDATGQAADRVQDAAGQAAGAVQQAAGQVQDTAQQLGGQVRYGARRARSGLEGSLQESPLAAGAIALAVGVAVGLAAPSTDVEDRLMGEARDSVVQKAQDTAQDTLGKVQHVAERTADATKETAQQEARNQGLTGTKG
jgi:uncharacterized protein YjbJ (UPF0337 family)